MLMLQVVLYEYNASIISSCKAALGLGMITAVG